MERGPTPVRDSNPARLVPDPINPHQVVYDLSGKLNSNPLQNDRKASWWTSNAPGFDKFATVNECPKLSDIGHTRVKSHLNGYDRGWYTDHHLDAGLIVAPQYYKNEAEYAKFPLKPRQQQLLYAGNDMMPIPQGRRTFWRGEAESADVLKSSVFVRQFHVPPDELRTQIQAKYWPKRNVPKPEDDWWRSMMKRMMSSFAGGNVDKSGGVWLPKGELYVDENRIQGPADALQFWDANVNPGVTRSGSLGGFAKQPATYATLQLRKQYEGQ
eukprot:Gregarina_sp_Poly_1__3926@NODE_2178_length_2546_cov_214_139169_g1403_i0_p2_GENE_NODE_2178_length_2546_cov_214_139169_g1403_i0NODE_2178_length_2546_cov_214_139169_g1403_i0_p2_ORF_typecomplete_len270_score35_70CBM_5_12_2/PF14600_6/0_77CBM_5_12_2/PF14600_6/2_1e03CBM_5_12_2/PF14600_6/2_5e02_NODE_2178_length_2546_cov_214_139169_g1403_i016132422